jgi:nitroimidazol reductase NimA-like FMN-containing flavoprotein (pyridoxamine 5'-phosphate oxidase superfamily)
MSGVPTEVAELLDGAKVMAHLATSVDDRPHVAPVWYWYDEGTIEMVTTGRKLENIRQNPRVALSIQKDRAGETEWMVTLQGTATVVEDEEATDAATRRINAKYDAPGDAWPENVLVRVDVATAAARTY